MSVSLEEVINSGGYTLDNVEDCKWLLGKKEEFEELCEKADEVVDEYERKKWEEENEELEDE